MIASVGVAGTVAMPATAQQTLAGPAASASQGVVKHVKRALRIGRTANRRSAKAIRIARAARRDAGQPGPQGPQGETGPQGPPGAQGPAGTALAYAHMTLLGSEGGYQPGLSAYRTHGIVRVERVGTGIYCLEPSPEVESQAFDSNGNPTRPTVVSVELSSLGNLDSLIVQSRSGNSPRCVRDRFEVRTYRDGALDNTVAFNLIVP